MRWASSAGPTCTSPTRAGRCSPPRPSSVRRVSEPPGQPRIEFEPHADPTLAAGSYANGLAIWHTLHEFTFDFFVSSQPPAEGRTKSGEVVIRAPHRLVARVRVPPTSVFDIIRTISQNFALYEQKFGSSRTPWSPGAVGYSGVSRHRSTRPRKPAPRHRNNPPLRVTTVCG